MSRELTVDPNPVVARAAKAIWQALTDDWPALASLPAGTVSLENVCGQKFRVTNHNDIDLSFQLVIGSPYHPKGIRIPSQASRDMTVDAKDSVHLRYADREIASAAVGPPCHRSTSPRE